MLTPQEVSDRSFPKSTFGGYSMSEVDEFLDVLTEDYSTLYKENAMLKSKMKVLVDKISEYRSTEDAMRTTLLTAQKMANAMVAEAEEKKAQLLKDAESTVLEQVNAIRQSIVQEQARLAAAQSATAAFVSQVREACTRQLDALDELPHLNVPAPSTESAPDPVESAAEEIDSSLSKLVASEEPSAEPFSLGQVSDQKEIGQDFESTILSVRSSSSSSDAADEEDDASFHTTRRIDFDHLQFGRDYEVK